MVRNIMDKVWRFCELASRGAFERRGDGGGAHGGLVARLKSALAHVRTAPQHRRREDHMTQNCTMRMARHHMLALLAMLGLALAGLVQHSTTVSILALSDPLSSEQFADYVANTSYVKMYCEEPENATAGANFTQLDRNFTSGESEEYDDVPVPTKSTLHLKVPLLEEDREDSLLREAFLWGATVSPLPGYQVARRVGAKRMLGYGVLMAGALSLLVPAAWGSAAHVILRAAQGAATGVIWPALHILAATWCPKPQRSLFVSAYAAWSLGCGAAALLGPWLVRGLGRDSLFYLEGALALAWFAAWSFLVANTPASALKDKWYLAFQPQHKDGPGSEVVAATPAVPERPHRAPWRRLLTSGAVWGCAAAVLGGQWGQATLHLAGTKYLQLVYGFALTEDRVLSALPHLGHFLCSLTFGLIADHVIGRQFCSITTTRKMFVYTAHFLPAAALFVIGYTGCDPAAPAALFVAAVLVSSALGAGAYASALEIAPNFAGAVFAVSHTAGAAGGLAANYVITEGLHGSLPGSWRLVFCSAALVLVVTASAFLALGSGTEQPWNAVTADPVELAEVNPGGDLDSLSPLADQKSLSPDASEAVITPENCMSEISVDKNDVPSTSTDKNNYHQNNSVLEQNNIISPLTTTIVELNGISRVSSDVDFKEREESPESESRQSLLPPPA